MDEFQRLMHALLAFKDEFPEMEWDTAAFASGTVLRVTLPIDIETLNLFNQGRQMFAPR